MSRASTKLALLLALAACLAGCDGASDVRPGRAVRALFAGRPVSWRTLTMPRHAPRAGLDLECDVFGYRIDCSAGTYTWLLGDSTDRPNVAHFTLTQSERDSIWSWLLDADYFDMPQEMRVPQTFVPLLGDWQIQARVGNSRYVARARAVLGSPSDATPGRGHDLELLCERITRLVERKAEVQRLPRPVRHGFM